jgi:hypothetical protein
MMHVCRSRLWLGRNEGWGCGESGTQLLYCVNHETVIMKTTYR